MFLRNVRVLILRQWGIMVICVLITGLISLLVSTLITPLYASATLVQVTPAIGSSPTGSASLADDELVHTEAQLATSYPVLQAVAAHYAGLTEIALAKEVAATPRAGTQLFAIEVQDANSGRAANLANAIAGALIQQQSFAMKQGSSSEQELLQQELNQTNDQIKATISQLNALQTDNQAQENVLQAQLNALEQHYDQWQALQAQVQIAATVNGHFLQVAQSAQPVYTPLRPDTSLNIGLGLLIGLVLGLCIAWLYTELTICEHTPDELQQMLNWPVLGTIWQTPDTLSESPLHPQAQASNLAGYRSLDVQLSFASVDGPLRTLVVASTLAAEGKSTLAANLAVTMARAGKNVVLIDANLRQPAVSTLFQNVADKPGLSNALLALNSRLITPAVVGPPTTGVLEMAGPSIALESFCYSVGLANLRIMPTGSLPAEPATLLTARAMDDLLKLLSTCGSDIVLFDTPPMADFADASILAAKVDGTLVVINPAYLTRMQIRRMKTNLRQAGARIVGCVFHTQSPKHQHTSGASSDQAVPKKPEVALSTGISQRTFPSPIPASDTALTDQVKGLVHTAFHNGRNTTK